MKYKNTLSLEFFPITHSLLGFAYTSGVTHEDETIGVDEFCLGFIILTINFTRKYPVK